MNASHDLHNVAEIHVTRLQENHTANMTLTAIVVFKDGSRQDLTFYGADGGNIKIFLGDNE